MESREGKMNRAFQLLLFALLIPSSLSISQIPAFQVNDDAGPRGCPQHIPAVFSLADGGFVAFWEDERNGSGIFGQNFSAEGLRLGVNFQLLTGTIYIPTGPGSRLPLVIDGNGIVLMAYVVSNGTHDDLLIQKYTLSGDPIGTPLKCNHDIIGTYIHDYRLACDATGDFVAVWSDIHNGNMTVFAMDVYAQIFLKDGSLLGKNFRVNDDTTGTTIHPAVAMDVDGDFVIVWNNGDIFQQRYRADGTALGNNVLIEGLQGTPSIAVDAQGGYIVAGSENQAQLFSEDGTAKGEPIEIGTSATSYLNTIAMAANGTCAFIWGDRTDDIDNLYARVYRSDGSPREDVIAVTDFTQARTLEKGSVAIGSGGRLMVSWASGNPNDFYDFDVFARCFDENGKPLTEIFKVNDDTLSAFQATPFIAVDKQGDFAVAWEDERNGSLDIFAQWFDKNGVRSGANVQVNDSIGRIPGPLNQRDPSMVCDAQGNSVIVWRDKRTGWESACGQRYAQNGDPIGGNFTVILPDGSCENPKIAGNDSGRFVVVWYGQMKWDDDWNVYIQLYDAAGNRVGSYKKVNVSLTNSQTIYPNIVDAVMDPVGRFVLVWQLYRNGPTDIYARRFDRDGTPIGGDFKVNPDDGRPYHGLESILMDGEGNVSIVWSVLQQDGTYRRYVNRFTGEGWTQSETTILIEGLNTAAVLYPDATMDTDGSAVLACRMNEEMVAQAYGRDWTKVGQPFRLIESGGSLDIKLKNGLVYTTWVDARPAGRGLNIWASVTSLSSVLQSQNDPPKGFSLSQNYPNPFNGNTEIRFTVPSSSHVTLTVFDVLGRVKAVLNDKTLEAGEHSTILSSADYSSGIYIVRMSAAGFSTFRKLVVLK
jgi:hypothetical protein